MPLIKNSTYQAPFLVRKNHLNTIYAGALRKVDGIQYTRERINTPDDDFIDLDWSKKGSNKLLLALHGLEGAADRPYIRGLLKHANSLGWDGLGMNFRSCSGEMNRQLRVYHSGATDDLEVVIQHIFAHYDYEYIALAGFSLGGNVVLKYIGDKGEQIDSRIKGAATASVPCDLFGTKTRFQEWDNEIYVRRFLKTLKEKISAKEAHFPNAVDYDRLRKVKTVFGFDDIFTGPVHGFDSADDYYKKCSSIRVLDKITIPTLLINAADDSFLGPTCYPRELAAQHPYFHLEIPSHGGHVGFVSFGKQGRYWSEERMMAFLDT